VCLAFSARDAAAQRGGGHASGGHAGGGAVHAAAPRAAAPATVGHAVPRPGYPGYPAHPIYGHPGYPYYGYGYRPYYPYYGYGYPYYPYYGYPGFSIGIGFGFGYGYGYGYYGYPYYGYAYPGYTYQQPVYVNPGGGSGSVAAGNPQQQGEAYGGVRIQGAPSDAQVYADGYFVGSIADFNGSSQQLSLPAGVHKIEVRSPGQAPVEFDVNIQAGQTVTYRVGR
jgi:hypothetical protein